MKKSKLLVLALSLPLFFGFLSLSGQVQGETSNAGQDTSPRIIKDIRPDEAAVLIKNNRNNSDFIILDVRTPKEFKGEHILGAKNLDYYSSTFRHDLNKLDKTRRYLIYCRSGRRSGIALNLMKALDFKEVYSVLGGIIAWKADGLSLVR